MEYETSIVRCLSRANDVDNSLSRGILTLKSMTQAAVPVRLFGFPVWRNSEIRTLN